MTERVEDKMLVSVLRENNLLTPEEIEDVLREVDLNGGILKQALVRKGYFVEEEFSLIERMATARKKEFFVGKYELLGKIGQGGMGRVFRARHSETKDEVAIKILSPELSEDPSFVARFHREATSAQYLQHRNIVKTIEYGTDSGSYYLVMEYVDGDSLAQIMQVENLLDQGMALEITEQIAHALGHIHSQDLIHRDIKPDNILVLFDNTVKLIDMGLVRSTRENNLTMTGSVIGTPHYLSPEQAQGEKNLDIRGDVYSLGATLFHMTTGRPPYQGDNPLDVIVQHVNTPLPNPKELNPHLSQSIADLIVWMMDKDRTKRPQSPEEVVQEIERIRKNSSSILGSVKDYVTHVVAPDSRRAQVAKKVRRPVRPGLVFLFLLLFLTVGGVYVWGNFLRQYTAFNLPDPEEVDAKSLIHQAEYKVENREYVAAFFEYRKLFDNYSQTKTFQKENSRVKEGAEKLMKALIKNLSHLDLSQVLQFSGSLSKVQGDEYHIKYEMNKREAWRDWRLTNKSKAVPDKFLSTIPQGFRIFSSELEFESIRKIKISFKPVKNCVISISVGPVHVLIRESEKQVYLWEGALFVPKGKYETVSYMPLGKAGTGFKMLSKNCFLFQNPWEELTLVIDEKELRESQAQAFEAQVEHNTISMVKRELIRYEPKSEGVPLYLAFSRGVKLLEVEVSGQFRQNWLEDLLQKVLDNWNRDVQSPNPTIDAPLGGEPNTD